MYLYIRYIYTYNVTLQVGTRFVDNRSVLFLPLVRKSGFSILSLLFISYYK